MTNFVHFLLVPDRYAGRLVRRELAEVGSWLGVQVGTWTELLELCRTNYRLPLPSDKWENLRQSIPHLQDAFWQASSLVAEKECINTVSQTLDMLLRARIFDIDSPSPKKWDQFPPRCQKHLHTLEALWHKADRYLPLDLELTKRITGTQGTKAIRKTVVYWSDDLMQFTHWQKDVLEKLGKDSEDIQRDERLQKILQKALIKTPAAPKGKALHFIQKYLFENTSSRVAQDQSLQWIICRDHLEETETTISMIQNLMSNDALSPSDFAILIPDDDKYAAALYDVATSGGLPLSGLDVTIRIKDLGRESIRLFLLTRRRPAPVLALASLLSSPLMPWDAQAGMSLAQEVIDGRFELKPMNGMNDQERKMLRVIRDSHQTVVELAKGLKEFVSLLNSNEYPEHAFAASQTVQDLLGQISGRDTIDIQVLLGMVTLEAIIVSEEKFDSKDGVAIFKEHGEPWRRVKYLFVIGFSEGHYPIKPANSSVFSAIDLNNIQQQTGAIIDNPTTVLAKNRLLFRRQLMAASEQVTFLVPSYDSLANNLDVSTSIIFMASLIAGCNEPEQLLLSIDLAAERKAIVGLPSPSSLLSYPPRKIFSADLDLKGNLLELNKRKDGSLRPQSPSSLTTLMSSPLAWLLDRFGIHAREWVPESLDIMTQGTLSHEVFERLFTPNVPIPPQDIIRRQIPQLLEQATSKIFPYLLNKEWHVERHNLEQGISKAACAWRDILEGLQATPVGAEAWLSGELNGVPIRGKADLLLQLPSGRLLVVDYKKSSSPKRRKQMESGYDSQAELYRRMVMLNGIPDILTPDPKTKIGSMYFLMNDQVALVDDLCSTTGLPFGVEELGINISMKAIEMIGLRLKEVEKGYIHLNRTTDEKLFDEKAGIKLYALDNSPLLRLFLIEEVVQ